MLWEKESLSIRKMVLFRLIPTWEVSSNRFSKSLCLFEWWWNLPCPFSCHCRRVQWWRYMQDTFPWIWIGYHIKGICVKSLFSKMPRKCWKMLILTNVKEKRKILLSHFGPAWNDNPFPVPTYLALMNEFVLALLRLLALFRLGWVWGERRRGVEWLTGKYNQPL